jgi:hypothetical protein
MDDYDTDIIAWSDRQAALLRRRGAGELVNGVDLDWLNIADQIESVGQSQVDRVESWLFRMTIHLLKAQAWPLSPAMAHWQGKARGLKAQARRKYRSSMARKIDLAGIYADALQALPDTIDGNPPLPVPAVCAWTLETLLTS